MQGFVKPSASHMNLDVACVRPICWTSHVANTHQHDWPPPRYHQQCTPRSSVYSRNRAIFMHILSTSLCDAKLLQTKLPPPSAPLHSNATGLPVFVPLLLPCSMACRRALAMRNLSVCPSVCQSVCQTRDLWQNGRKICPDFYTIRKII